MEVKPLPASLTVSADPPGSTILLNNQAFDYRDKDGLLRLNGLKPDTYTLVVRNPPSYREFQRTLTLAPGQFEHVDARLEPLPGTLHVAPTIDETDISIKDARTFVTIATFRGQVPNMQIAPGNYRLTISKDGYQPWSREVTLQPAQSIYLEPSLEPVGRARPQFRPDAATSMQTSKDGKFIIVALSGRSGNVEAEFGAVDVTLNGGQMSVGSVSGMLTGLPCQVQLVRLENVAELSFIEPPGTVNLWARAVVRVRPKDSKRAVHFLINWKFVQGM